jgi:hypothetical protein
VLISESYSLATILHRALRRFEESNYAKPGLTVCQRRPAFANRIQKLCDHVTQGFG